MDEPDGEAEIAPARRTPLRLLDFDSQGQLVASVLSKKVAAGSTHVMLDMPIGHTAKVRSSVAADALEARLLEVGKAVGLGVRVVRGDGSQPIGRGIGPAPEARDVLAVLQCQADAPRDLRDRALVLAGSVLELCGRAPAGTGARIASEVLEDGRAWRKFQASHTHPVLARSTGLVAAFDNRRLAKAVHAARRSGAMRRGLSRARADIPARTLRPEEGVDVLEESMLLPADIN